VSRGSDPSPLFWFLPLWVYIIVSSGRSNREPQPTPVEAAPVSSSATVTSSLQVEADDK